MTPTPPLKIKESPICPSWAFVPFLPRKQYVFFIVYVFLGSPTSLIDLMNLMQTAQLFDKGEYMVIYVDMITYSEKEARKYLWSKLVRVSLVPLHIVIEYLQNPTFFHKMRLAKGTRRIFWRRGDRYWWWYRLLQ